MTTMRVLLLTVLAAIFSLDSIAPTVLAARVTTEPQVPAEITEVENELRKIQVSGVDEYEAEQQSLLNYIEDIKYRAYNKGTTPYRTELQEKRIEETLQRARRLVELAKDKRTVEAKRMLDESKSTISYKPAYKCRDAWRKLSEKIRAAAQPIFTRVENEGGYSIYDEEATLVYGKIKKFYDLTMQLEKDVSLLAKNTEETKVQKKNMELYEKAQKVLSEEVVENMEEEETRF